MEQVHLIIAGYVQGVGFRHFVKREARRRGITGWVKNREDGAVEALFQGDKKSLTGAITLCRKGPFLSEVKDIKITWGKQEEVYTAFDVKT